MLIVDLMCYYAVRVHSWSIVDFWEAVAVNFWQPDCLLFDVSTYTSLELLVNRQFSIFMHLMCAVFFSHAVLL